MVRIEAAMRAHLSDVVLQTMAIRALYGGNQWPEDLQQKSGYDVKSAIFLTKAAMSQHGPHTELQIAGLEALSKYINLPVAADVKADGGEELVKSVLEAHPKVAKVQSW